jgi:hypothetical protein
MLWERKGKENYTEITLEVYLDRMAGEFLISKWWDAYEQNIMNWCCIIYLGEEKTEQQEQREFE